MKTSTVTIEIQHSDKRDSAELAEMIAQRAYTIQGVSNAVVKDAAPSKLDGSAPNESVAA